MLAPLLADASLAEEARGLLAIAFVRRTLADVAGERPELSVGAGFDGAAVVEDLDRAALLAPLTSWLEQLARKLDDSRLVWNARAYKPSLTLYELAKRRVDEDPSLSEVIDPLEEVFASRRNPKVPALTSAGSSVPTRPLGSPATELARPAPCDRLGR